jgi:uncharacterized protein YjbJ (UPF0337 family)
MGLLDKLLGRTKQAARDVTGDSSLRSEGVHQEMEGAADERASEHESMAQEEREREAEHHAARSDETTPPA